MSADPFVLFRATGDAIAGAIDNKDAHAAVTSLFIRARQHKGHIGHRRIMDPQLTPFSTQPSAVRVAVVLIPETSEPAPASVMQ
jgi:hypothetical protein